METVYFTCYEIGGIYNSKEDASKAWKDAGKPRRDGNSVWVTEHHVDTTGCAIAVNTYTIAK